MPADAPDAAPNIVSVDDHLVEPASLWESRLPSKLRARGPRAIDTPDGVWWEVDGERKLPLGLTSASAGVPLEDRALRVVHWDELRPGAYNPVERVKDMDIDGVLASLCFPNDLVGFGGRLFNIDMKDRELSFACIQAYNDFVIDEWAGSAPGRLFAMVMLPYWDTALAVEELQRCAARGAVAVAFTESPARMGYPSIHDPDHYWDPVFAAAQDAELPLCVHFGSSSWIVLESDPVAPYIVGSAAAPLTSALSCIDWILSGVFERFPKLQIVLSESYLGWVPFVLEHTDWHWTQHFAWATDRNAVPRAPSEYFHQNVSACLVHDPFGMRHADEIGVDRILAETDYPHPDTHWPNSRKVIDEYLEPLSPEDRTKVLRTNAEKLFHLELADL